MAHHAEARHRRCAGYGHHCRAHRGRPCRPGMGGQAHGRLPRARPTRRRFQAGLCGTHHRGARRRYRQVRARIRQHPALGHQDGCRAGASRRRRADNPRGVRGPGADRLMAPCGRRAVADAALGIPGRLAARVAARFHPAGHARRQQSPARPRAGRRHEARSADHGTLHLQHQSGQPGARDKQDRARLEPRGPVLRHGGAFRHGHGGLCRHRPPRRRWRASTTT